MKLSSKRLLLQLGEHRGSGRRLARRRTGTISTSSDDDLDFDDVEVDSLLVESREEKLLNLDMNGIDEGDVDGVDAAHEREFGIQATCGRDRATLVGLSGRQSCMRRVRYQGKGNVGIGLERVDVFNLKLLLLYSGLYVPRRFPFSFGDFTSPTLIFLLRYSIL